MTLYHTKITDMLVADDNLSLYVNAGEVLVKVAAATWVISGAGVS